MLLLGQKSQDFASVLRELVPVTENFEKTLCHAVGSRRDSFCLQFSLCFKKSVTFIRYDKAFLTCSLTCSSILVPKAGGDL